MKTGEIERFAQHRNGFGFLRLLFASLVIAAHTPEMIDGDRRRELLTRLFGTISFGDFAVDCFFLVSGYLIVGSFVKEPRVLPYLRKRVLRIYPGFLVASLLCLVVVAPIAGASAASLIEGAGTSLRLMLALQMPRAEGIFPGTHHPALNGAMWTIAYEFRCYLLVLLLGLVGAYRAPRLVALFAAGLLAGFATVPAAVWLDLGRHLPFAYYWLGEGDDAVRLTGVFLVGSVYYLWRERIRPTRVLVIAAAVALVACLFVAPLAEPGLAVFGGYLIFAFAGLARTGILSRINNREDVSYGVYLYGWPVGKLVLWGWPGLPVLAAGIVIFAGAYLCGWLSWRLVEKPVMQRFGRRARAGREQGEGEGLSRVGT